MEALGHRQISMTTPTYTYVLPGLKQATTANSESLPDETGETLADATG
jgi:hypothetical protein